MKWIGLSSNSDTSLNRKVCSKATIIAHLAVPAISFVLIASSGATRSFNVQAEQSYERAIIYNGQKSSLTCPAVVNKSIDILKQKNLNKIELMSHFQADWNGNGGLPFSEEAIALFNAIIQTLNIQPVIAPTGRSSLYMEFQSSDMSELIFEIFVDRAERVFIPQGNYSLAESEIFDENICSQIKESVRLFYGS